MTIAIEIRGFSLAFLFAFSVIISFRTAVFAGDRCETREPIAAEKLPEPFMENDLWGYRSAIGEVVLPPKFQFAGDFTDHGLAAVFEDAESGWQLINIEGDPVISPLSFENGPDRFVERLARYRSQDKIGFFDDWGCVVIEARFDWAFPFSQGRAAVCSGCAAVANGEHTAVEGGRWGYVDPNGEIVIPLQYDRASGFEDGRARVETNNDSYFIDVSGNRPQQN